jgi:hypothetical protein
MLAALSSTTYFTELIFGIVFGFILYRVSSSFRQQWGRPPWNIPPWGWFAFGFVLGLLGVLLYLIAHATTKGSIRRSGAAPPYRPGPGPGPGIPQQGYPPPPVPPPSVPPQGWAPPTGGPAGTPVDGPAEQPPS